DCVGYSQAHRLALVQMCDITGVYGLSFLVLLGNVSAFSLFKLLTYRKLRYLFQVFTGFVCVSIALAYGVNTLNNFSKVSEKAHETVKVGILQGDIPQDVKWDPSSKSRTFIRYERLAKDAFDHGARMLIWPETSIPVIIGGSDMTWKYATNISRTLDIPMLIGAPFETHLNKRVVFFNSAFLVEDGKLTQRYDKIHLVPFGEYMPLSWILPLGPGIAAREEDYSAGSHLTLMKPKGFPPFSVLICYEAIFPELARSAVESGAKVLVNITNDGWFGKSAAPYQHLDMAGFRAVENRVWMIRAANTGVSGVFDPTGRLVVSLPLMEQGALVCELPRTPNAGSFYTRNGDIFAWITIVLLLAMIAPNIRMVFPKFKRST
ncbi:MAG: apolipoprotein N-acyltransferase, partial [Desulfomonilaceae bacterium]